MNAIIPAVSYCDKAVFDLEQDRIFSRSWTFAGLRSALADDNSWITAKVAGKSVVIQNFQGQLRCFLNVCSHRFSEIRLTPEGKGPLRCPYHGWTYDAEGCPVGIPHRPRFDNLCVADLGLTRYRVELCGELVFVNPSLEGSDLRAAMGSFFDKIESLTNGMGGLIHASEWTIECNWKILVENTLEAYHVSFVHPETFAKLKADFGSFQFDSWGSSFLGKIDMEALSVKKFVSGFPSRHPGIEGYYHFSLFPTYLMSTSYGVIFSVQQIVPLSESRTWMRSLLFHRPAESGTNIRPAMEPTLHNMAADFNQQVLAEDQRICEAVQRGASQIGGKRGMLSDEEQRVAEFQRIYTDFMGNLR